MAGCRGSQRTTAARFSYEGSSPDCHRARRPHPGILRPLSFPVERPPQPPAGAAWVCPTRRPHTPTYAADGGFQSVIPAASAAWRRPRLPQWSWAAAWAIGHMRTTGRPWRAERACRRPPDLDRAAKECRNLLGADATKSARPSSIIQIDRNLLETKLDRLVAEKVTEPLNAMPGASGRRDRQRRQIRARRGAEGVPRRPLRPEPDRQGRQARPEGAQAQGRGLRIRGHRAPQTARGKRRPAAISTGPGSMTNSRKRTDHRAMDGHGPKCTSFRALPRRSQLYRGY